MFALNARTTRLRGLAPRFSRPGFTLIEIMVVLALTLVMMTMFATIFSMTGTFVTKQKAVGENDQSARILTTVLKTDLQGRTMRFVAPFHPNMQPLSDDPQRQGYFYVSENDPTDDTDDVLQFTTTLNSNFLPKTNPASGGQFYGAALNLAVPWQANTNYVANALVRPASANTNTSGLVFKNKGAAFTSGATEPTWPTTLPNTIADGVGTWTALASPIDQPDGDDGIAAFDAAGNRTLAPAGTNPNNTGASQYAEVTYFLRHGNLYRRVLLIRQPYDNNNPPPPVSGSSQPYDTDGPSLMIPGAYPPYPPNAGSGNFWTDFDYAARINVGGSPGVNFLAFAGVENSLNNSNAGNPLSIGRPDNRFGFDQTYDTASPGPVANGAPREFALQYDAKTDSLTSLTTPPPFFFGRFTHEETSNVNFQFPGNLPLVNATNVSPMAPNTVLAVDSLNSTMWLLDAAPPTPGKAVSFASGVRRGEDILLTNVVSFDVKLWDPHYSEVAGSDVNRNGVIDAGAAFADVGHTANTGDFQQTKNAFPVYGPRIDTGYALPAAPLWAPAFTRTFNGITYNYNNVFDTWYRFFNFDNLARAYDVNDPTTTTGVFAPAPYRPRLGNPWQPSHAYNVGDLVDPINTANGYVYKCVTAGTSAAAPPAGQPDPFSLTDLAVSPPPTGIVTGTDGTVVWNAQAPVAVQAIQITVKYLDPSQNIMRQVTIVQSLTP
jgi:prepilin-type N-terminal cleavage/methylation domain-containing protein